jgi:hypothetical protein
MRRRGGAGESPRCPARRLDPPRRGRPAGRRREIARRDPAANGSLRDLRRDGIPGAASAVFRRYRRGPERPKTAPGRGWAWRRRIRRRAQARRRPASLAPGPGSPSRRREEAGKRVALGERRRETPVAARSANRVGARLAASSFGSGLRGRFGARLHERLCRSRAPRDRDDDGPDAGRGEQTAIARSYPNHPNVRRVLKKRNRQSQGLTSFLCGVSFFGARVRRRRFPALVAAAQIRLESR